MSQIPATIAKTLSEVDQQIQALLASRARIVQETFQTKKQMLSLSEIRSILPPPSESVAGGDCFFPVQSEYAIQVPAGMVPTVSYLGPPRSYSHRAAVEAFRGVLRPAPQSNMRKVLTQLISGECQYAVVPIENSTDGMIDDVIDVLLEQSHRIDRLHIVGEFCIRVQHCLLGRQSNLMLLRRIVSRDTALRQCSQWLADKCPHVQAQAIESTSLGAAMAAQDETVGVVGDYGLAEVFGLSVLCSDIGDSAFNRTQFLIIGCECNRPTGRDKTLFAATGKGREISPILREVLASGLMITRLHTRPLRTLSFATVLIIEALCHQDDPAFLALKERLVKVTDQFHVLGSMPVMEDAQ
jgi:chorismate mutase/prephenate dehydratase